MPPSKSEPKVTGSKSAVAEYIAVQASRLARMATANGSPALAHLIDRAVLEAWREASEGGVDAPVTAPSPASASG